MTGRLANKVALISGTAGGQGRRAALHFAAEGAKVVGCDVKEVEALETVEIVTAAGGEMVSLQPIDLTDEDSVKAWIDFAVDAYGDFDILYNNAAVAKAAALEDLRREDWDWNIANEVTLVFLAVKHAVPVFERRGGGVIINVGSIAGMAAASRSAGLGCAASNRDVVLVIELAQQVGERLDLSTGKTGNRREQQAVRCDGAEPLTLPRLEAQLVDVIVGQRASERTPHPDQLSSRQRGLPVVECGQQPSPSVRERTRDRVRPGRRGRQAHTASRADTQTQGGAVRCSDEPSPSISASPRVPRG
jgi:NAD(P)-dependent dehydrogenase (short-subunit alcohol dehydrogenase family)